MKGCSSWRQVRRGCMFSAVRSVLWCPLVEAESDPCGRNGRWKGLLIFRHNRVRLYVGYGWSDFYLFFVFGVDGYPLLVLVFYLMVFGLV